MEKQLLIDKFVFNFTYDELAKKYNMDRNKVYTTVTYALQKQKEQPWKIT